MREDQVYRQLAQVVDPELDRPLTELGFIGGVEISGDDVTVHFRLPTYFCAANFAFLMASDIRDRVRELPWVRQVEVRLTDHFVADEVTAGVNAGEGFVQTFPEFAEGELEDLRETFRRKAFLARQERLARWLMALGWEAERLPRLQLGDLMQISARYGDEETPVQRYLAVLQDRGLSLHPQAPVFVQPDGTRVAPAEWNAHLEAAMRTRLSMEFNTALCRGLLQTRYGAELPDQLPMLEEERTR